MIVDNAADEGHEEADERLVSRLVPLNNVCTGFLLEVCLAPLVSVCHLRISQQFRTTEIWNSAIKGFDAANCAKLFDHPVSEPLRDVFERRVIKIVMKGRPLPSLGVLGIYPRNEGNNRHTRWLSNYSEVF